MVATNRRNAGPNLTPYWYLWDGENFLISTSDSVAKVKHAPARPEHEPVHRRSGEQPRAVHVVVYGKGRDHWASGEAAVETSLKLIQEVPLHRRGRPGKHLDRDQREQRPRDDRDAPGAVDLARCPEFVLAGPPRRPGQWRQRSSAWKFGERVLGGVAAGSSTRPTTSTISSTFTSSGRQDRRDPAAGRAFRRAKARMFGGAIVSPGFVDLHGHWYEGSPWGVSIPRSTCLRSGVTTPCDAGTTGYENFPRVPPPHGPRRVAGQSARLPAHRVARVRVDALEASSRTSATFGSRTRSR